MIGIMFATLVLALGYALGDQWVLASIVTGLGFLWLAGVWHNWDWATSIGLVAFIGLAALGVRLELSAVWMLFGVVASLAAWDLVRFWRRVAHTKLSGQEPSLQHPHFQRLLMVSGLGLLLGGAALSLQINLNFGWAVLLGLLMTISLSWVVGSIRRGGE